MSGLKCAAGRRALLPWRCHPASSSGPNHWRRDGRRIFWTSDRPAALSDLIEVALVNPQRRRQNRTAPTTARSQHRPDRPLNDRADRRTTTRRSRRCRRKARGGWRISVKSATSRSLLVVASMARSESPVKAEAQSREPRVFDRGPEVEIWVRGELIGASGEASGVISRGRFFSGPSTG